MVGPLHLAPPRPTAPGFDVPQRVNDVEAEDWVGEVAWPVGTEVGGNRVNRMDRSLAKAENEFITEAGFRNIQARG